VALSRLTFYFNVIVGILLVVILALLYWFGWRVLPKTSGEIAAPLSAPGSITRDSMGVAHIEAASVEDALFLQGYAMAQDRLFQMDALRRFAAGELSEILGRRTLESDQAVRRLRLRRIAEQMVRTLPAEDRAYLSAFCRGVNHFIDTHRGALPLEFTVLQYDPKPWTLVDEALVQGFMYRELTTSWEDDLDKARMLQTGDKRLVDWLFPKGATDRDLPGSNAWAISGKFTASGKPLLANDPHLQWGLPSRWWMVHLKTPQMNVAGASIVGAPGVVVGHNERIAWGVTNLHFDVQDLYIEEFDPRTGAYRFGSQRKQARPERELILVKGEQPVEFNNWVSRHGPLWVQEGGRYLFLKWVAAETPFEFPFIQINRARNWQEFREGVKRFPGPGQNFVYADVDGNIGYQASGRLPIRKGFDGDVPVPGTGEFEWQGIVPFEELPSVYNPPSGFVVTANQNPFPKSYPYNVNGTFAPPYRTRQIQDRLKAGAQISTLAGTRVPDSQALMKLTVENMLDIQKDVYSPFFHRLAKALADAASQRAKGQANLQEAVDVLKGWNGQMDKDQAAPLVVTLAYLQLRNSLAKRASGGKGGAAGVGAAVTIERLISEEPEGWFSDYDQWLLTGLVEGIEEGKKRHGSSVSRWKYGNYLEVSLKHPILGALPYVGDWFNVGPAPMSGGTFAVKQTSVRLGPSMRFVADLGNWEQSSLSVPLGQSGQWLSSHYKDMWKRYYVGESFPLPFAKVEGSTLRVVPATK
jgi:penicillin G amidase